MCIICVDVQKGLLFPYEALRNFREMKSSIPIKHYEDILALIRADIYARLHFLLLGETVIGESKKAVAASDPGDLVYQRRN